MDRYSKTFYKEYIFVKYTVARSDDFIKRKETNNKIEGLAVKKQNKRFKGAS